MKILIKEFLRNPTSVKNPYRTSMENGFIYLYPFIQDLDYTHDDQEDFDVLLASIYTTGYHEYIKFIKNNPGAFTVVGGWHPSLVPMDMIPIADAVVIGSGDSILREILEDKKKGIFKGYPKDVIPIRPSNDHRMTSVGLDMSHKIMSARTRIGCTESCTFCCTPAIYKNSSVCLDLDIFEQDLYQNKGRFTDIFITDTDIFQHNEHNLERICRIIQKCGLRGHAFISSKYYTERKMNILIKYKWFRILIGVEGKCSANYGKVNRNIETIREKCKKSGIVFCGGFIFSHEDPIESFMDLCWELMPDQMTFSYLCYFPGTKLGIENNITKEDYPLLNGFDNAVMFVPDPKASSKKLAEFCCDYYTSNRYKTISKMVDNDICLLNTQYYYDITHQD